MDYRATEKSEFTDLPLVLIVNRQSAAASEIVAGAIQDHDRGIIVGETTFGDALVQSVYRISAGPGAAAGLALTTARFYTPSGRLIQRPWDAGVDEYLAYTSRDQLARTPRQWWYTGLGRKVAGDGGIEPDHHVAGPVEGFNPTRFGRQLHARHLFASFAQRFSAEGDARSQGAPKGPYRVARGFRVNEPMLRGFREYLKAVGMDVDESAFAKDSSFIEAMLKFEIDIALFGRLEARKNLIPQDPQAQLALMLFPEAKQLLQRRATAPVKR
jgi:carboxyl-terminal processing protease